MSRKSPEEVRLALKENFHYKKGCEGKKKYLDEVSAASRADWDKVVFKKKGHKGRADAHRAYKCHFCGFWHIGTMTNPAFRKDYEELVSRARTIYSKLPFFTPNSGPHDLEEFYQKGLIRKDVLVHGEYYLGWGRYAKVARWHASDQLFFHVAEVKGQECEQGVPHPTDGQSGYVFVAVASTTPTTKQIVYAAFGEPAPTA